MNSLPGIDYAWTRPTVQAIQAAGQKWVGRYLSGDTSKNLTAAEYQRLTAAGIPVVVVWETYANRAGAGKDAGIADARAALQLAAAIGLPPDCVIHFAVDYDAHWTYVAPYFAGIAIVMPKERTGIYGGYGVITNAQHQGYTYLWQTTAWSYGYWEPATTIRQTGNGPLPDTDQNQAMSYDYGQNPRPGTDDTMTPQQMDELANLVVAKLLAAPVTCPGDTPPTRSVAAILGYQDLHYSNIMNNINSLKPAKP